MSGDEEPGESKPDKQAELKRLFAELEEAVRRQKSPDNSQVGQVLQRLADMSDRLDGMEKRSALSQILATLRNVSEGVAGGLIIDQLLPPIKEWTRERSKPRPEPVVQPPPKPGEPTITAHMYVLGTVLQVPITEAEQLVDELLEDGENVYIVLDEQHARAHCSMEMAALYALRWRGTERRIDFYQAGKDELDDLQRDGAMGLHPESRDEIKAAIRAILKRTEI